VQLDYKASGGGVTINLPENKVGEIIKNVTGGEASFDVSKVDGAYSVTFTPKTGLSEIAKDGLKIKVIFPSGVVTLDSGAAKSLISQAHGTEITFEVKEMKTAELTAAQSSALPGTPEAFDVSVYSGGEAIHSYAGELVITVAYTGKLPVSVWYVSDAGATEKLPSTYSTQNKTVTFKPPHLSLYAVGYDGLPFEDVFNSDWYFGDVEFVYAAGLMTGTTETTFAPKTPVTRAMMVTVLGRHAGASSSSQTTKFKDIDANAYYAPYVAWASENGIVLGVGDNSFAPDREITRQELVTLLYRYAQFTGNAPTGSWAVRIPFNDADKLSGWAVEAVMWAYMNGLATGKPGNLFDPPGTASRAETAALLHRFVALLDDTEDSEED
jgi:hypothetical protein